MHVRGALLLVLLAALPAGGHGSTEPPPDPEPPPPDKPRPEMPPPFPWDPPDTPPPPPETPPPDPPAPQPQPPGPGGFRPQFRPPYASGRRSGPGEDAWRIWWEYNREDLLGLRKLTRGRIVITGDVRPDPLGARRDEVLGTLREIAAREDERSVRASALIALGRTGGDEDARLFVETVASEDEPQDLREAAVVALAILPPFKSADVTAKTRVFLEYVLKHPGGLPGRTQGLALCAAGLRARSDPRLGMSLLAEVAGDRIADGEEAAHLLFACGLAGHDGAVPELVRAARKGELGGNDLTDIQRAHAVTALGRAKGHAAIEDLVVVLGSRRSGLDTKRAAALALGRLLREEPQPDEEAGERAGRALRDCFEKENDTVLRGYAAVALGAAVPPRFLPQLMDAIDHGGNAAVKPYCALALGLGARTLGSTEGRRIGIFLRNELDKAAHMELGSALSLAVGLAGTTEAEKDLLERVRWERLPAASRGTAAQGIGLLGTASPEAVEVLKDTALNGTPGVLEDAALALGILGQRGIARELAKGLPRAGSAHAQARLMLAIGYLAHTETVEPLLEVLRDKHAKPTAREFAAVALGILGDLRDDDVLFGIDAWFDLYATTPATNELVRLY